MLEDAIYEAAPDLTSLQVEGLEEPAESGFIAIEKLLGTPPQNASPLPNMSKVESPLSLTSEGMD
jgi:hypothetical protein